MTTSSWRRALAAAILSVGSACAYAEKPDCSNTDLPRLSFVQFTSPNIATSPLSLLTIKGKLSLPQQRDHHLGCTAVNRRKLPAVVILHGSSGVDSRGDFYEAALNAARIATLQIEMWEARGVHSAVGRPVGTDPDPARCVFGARLPGRAPRYRRRPDRRLGFSWGGVNSLTAAERLYTGLFGGGRQFKAHAAHYPVCYAANAVLSGLPPPAQLGTQFIDLTGTPVLVQVGSLDHYGNGAARCRALAQAVNPSNANAVEVVEVLGAQHAFDRLMVPIVVSDPFGNEASYFATGVVPKVTLAPDVAQAYAARERVIRFFREQL